MKKLALIKFYMLIMFHVNAQEKGDEIQTGTIRVKKAAGVFTVAEEMPFFPGGEGALLNFLSTNIKYPKESKDNGITGIVYAGMIIDSTGKISDINIIKSPDTILSAETIRVIKLMPDWKPGIKNGTAVNVYITLPVRFKLY